MDSAPTKPNREWQESVTSIVEMGKYLDYLKNIMPNYDVEKIARVDFGIDQSTVRKVISLSKHPLFSKAEYADKLPLGWGTLYELKFLPEEFILQKLQERGSLEHVSKYDIWGWRGVKTRSKGKNSNKVSISGEKSLIEYAREGMKTEINFNGDAIETAKNLGISAECYRNVRALILLEAREELTPTDREFVRDLMRKIDKTRNVRPYYQQARPLVDKIWGVGKGRGFMSKGAQKKIEVFRNAIVILSDTCERVSEMEQPYMSTEDIDQSITELTEASKIIRRIAENLRRAKDV